MAAVLAQLLAQLGVELEAVGLVPTTPGLNCLGSIKEVTAGLPAIGLTAGTFLWHAEVGWAALDRLELERWLVDAPAGKHWIISERQLNSGRELPTRDDVDLILWGPRRYARWIGSAVLQGTLELSNSESQDESLEASYAGLLSEIADFSSVESESQQIDPFEGRLSPLVERANEPPRGPKGVVALRPMIDLADWFDSISMGMLPARPVLLFARIWAVEGDLLGPDGAQEKFSGRLLEDAFCSTLELHKGFEEMEWVPTLQRLRPHNWCSEEAVRSQLSQICAERRAWVVEDSGSDSLVRGSLLHWWRLDADSAHLNHREVLIPAWIVNFPTEGELLVHGLNGSRISLPAAE